jgi:hypothetical protein
MYRGHATECEAEARAMTNTLVRDRLLELAQRWDELADRVEQIPSVVERWWPAENQAEAEWDELFHALKH